VNGGRRSLADWLEYQQQLHPRSIDLGLERVRAVATRLELLPVRCRTVIVGGTNGKGSTAAHLAALLAAQGETVGLFTSPHLVRYNERIRVNGREVDDQQLVAAFERIEAARDNATLTFFEYNTLAALDLFWRSGTSVMVLEVGLGGRLDATNVVDADVAVVCSIGRDHMDWLGDSLEDIGREKAGIFRAGKAVVLGASAMPASIYRAIDELRCLAFEAGRDFDWLTHADGSWDYRDAAGRLSALPRPALAGSIQYRNASTALAAARLLGGARFTRDTIAAALTTVQLRGRMQIVPGATEWLLDVAHNEPAAAVLAQGLRERPPARRTLAVLGMLADKDVKAVVAQLDSQVDDWLVCGIAEARGLDSSALCARMGTVRGTVLEMADVAAGCERARAMAQAGDRVVVFGSFHTVGPALQWLGLY
jgi:dihydrofolate synthase/folylpolyglutamate synthase